MSKIASMNRERKILHLTKKAGGNEEVEALKISRRAFNNLDVIA